MAGDQVTEQNAENAIARWAGALFLWLIVAGVAGTAIIGQLKGTGSFADVSARVAASESLYRAALVLELLGALSSLILGTLLFALLAQLGRTLALAALICRVAEAAIGAVGVIFAFARVGFYTSGDSYASATAESLLDLTRFAGVAAHNISAFCFGVGSLIFFWLFARSDLLPRVLSWTGVFASVAVVALTVGSLVFPTYSGVLQYAWAPMAIAEIGTGIWLLLKGAAHPRLNEKKIRSPAEPG